MAVPVALDDVAIFLAVVECESFIGAARRLGVPQSSVSRRVAALESHVGSPLLKRTTRSLSLTPEGKLLFEACALPIAQVQAALGNVVAAKAGSGESLSIAVSLYICPDQFRAWVSDFGSERPELRLNLSMNSHNANFTNDDIDLAIQFCPPAQRSLVSVKLYDVSFHLVAAPELIQREPSLLRLTDPDELLSYACATILPIDRWSFISQSGEQRELTPARLAASSNDPWIAANAVRQGRGIGLLPEALLDDQLVPLNIAGWAPVASSVHAVFPRRLRNTPKIRSALESVQQQGLRSRNRDDATSRLRAVEASLAG